jgi:hypothetical protein
MHTDVFAGMEGHRCPHEVAWRSWAHNGARLVMAPLAAAMVLIAGSETANAGGPPGGGTGGTGGGTGGTGVGPVSFFDKWVAHDSELQLSPSGTGTLQ